MIPSNADEKPPCSPGAENQLGLEPVHVDDLEREKLSLELRNLQRAWWRQPEHYGPLLNAVVALFIGLGTVGFLFFSGFFEQRSKILELQRAKLELDVASLEREKHDLAIEKGSLQAEVEAVQRQRKELASDGAELQEQIIELAQQKEQLAKDVEATRKVGHELDAAQSTLRKLNEEYLSAAEEGVRMQRSSAWQGRIHLDLFGCSASYQGECDLPQGEDASPQGGYSSEEAVALAAIERQLLAAYAVHESACLSRRPSALLSSPPANLVGATRDWLHDLDKCFRSWERPKMPQP